MNRHHEHDTRDKCNSQEGDDIQPDSGQIILSLPVEPGSVVEACGVHMQ